MVYIIFYIYKLYVQKVIRILPSLGNNFNKLTIYTMGLDCMGIVGVTLSIPPEVLRVGGQTNKEDTLSWRHSYDAQWRHNHDTDCQHDAKPLPVVCRPQYTCRLVPSEHWITPLTDWGSDKMAAFSNAFSWMKTFEFWMKFHWNMFLRV